MFREHFWPHVGNFHFSMGRHPGDRGFGRFAGGFGGGFGHGGAEFRMGRKFAAADLQLVILALLAEKPSHGYELIKALEERSRGFYSPSPGMIYPALAYLEEVGYATAEAEGSRKLYHVTDAGRKYLEEKRSIVERMLNELDQIGERMERMRRAYDQGGWGSDEEEDDEGTFGHGNQELYAARRALKMALKQKRRCSPAEAKAIVEILRRAEREILGVS
jgi:DNA-binding PadR family transcriptional regulator